MSRPPRAKRGLGGAASRRRLTNKNESHSCKLAGRCSSRSSCPSSSAGSSRSLILAVAGGLIGTWIVLRGLAFYAHAVGTAAFPGLVLADGLGFAAAARRRRDRRAGRRRRRPARAPRGRARPLRLAHRARPRRRAGGRRDPRQRRLPLGRQRRDAAVRQPAARSTRGDFAFAAGQRARRRSPAALVLGPRWLATGLRPGRRARPRRCARRAPDIVLLALVALAAVAALSHARRAAGDRAARRPRGDHAARVLAAARRGSSATVALVAVEGVAGLWLSVQLNAPPGPAIAVLAGGVFAVVAAGRVLGRAPRRPPPRAPSRALALLAAGCGDGSGARRRPGQGRRDHDAARRLRPRRRRRPRSRSRQILRPNTDPHEYEPRPRDVRETADADVVLLNGDEPRPLDGRRRRGRPAATPAIVDLGARVPVRSPGRASGPRPRATTRTGGTTRATREAAVGGDPRRARRRPTRRRAASTRATPPPTCAGCARSTAGSPRCMRRGRRRAQRKLVTDHDAFGYFAAPLRHRGRRRGHPLADDAGPAVGGRRRAADAAHPRARASRRSSPRARSTRKLAQAIARQTGATSDYALYGDTLGPEGLERRHLPRHGARQRRRDGARLHRREHGDARSRGSRDRSSRDRGAGRRLRRRARAARRHVRAARRRAHRRARARTAAARRRCSASLLGELAPRGRDAARARRASASCRRPSARGSTSRSARSTSR